MEKKEDGIEQLRAKMDLLELHISRVPRHTKKWFVDYAQDYFEGDYGCCLKHIIDNFRGMTPIGYEELQAQINELQSELNLVKETLIKDKNNKVEQKQKSMKERIEELR